MGWAAAIPAVIGAFQQQDANRRAQNDANEARRNQKALMDEQLAAYKKRVKLYQDLVGMGHFDAAKSILNYDGNAAAQENQALGNQSAAAATLGYKPGDSVPIQQLRDTSAGFARQAANDKFQIRQNVAQNQMNALAATNPQSLSGTADQYGQMAQTSMSQQQSLAPYVQSILMNPQMQMRGRATATTSNPVGVIDPSLQDYTNLTYQSPFKLNKQSRSNGIGLKY